MSVVELTLRLIAAAALVGGLATLSFAAAVRLRVEGTLARWGATLVCGMALATLAFHVLMPLRLFTLPAAVAALALGLAATLGPAGNRRALRAALDHDGRFVRALSGLVARDPQRGWIFAFALLAVPVIARPFLVPPVSWDFVMYHGTKAALWVQNGGAPALAMDPGVPSWLLTRNHLAGGDVFTAWAMLPLSGDLYVGLVSLTQWLGVGLMVVLIAREIGVRGPGATVAAGFVLALSSFRLQVGSGYVELTLALTMGATLAFTLRYLRTGAPGAMVVACAALGLACSVKIVALPIAGLVLVVVAARAFTRRQITPLAASVLLLVALGAPWYAYNVVDTGAPLSPASLKFLGMPVGFSNDAYRHIARLPKPRPYVWATEWEAFSTMFGSFANARETAGWPMLVAFAMFAVALPGAIRRRPLGGLLLLAIFAANVAVIYSVKFTPWRLNASENATRFWVSAILVAVPLSTLTFRLRVVGPAYRLFLCAVMLFNLVRLATNGTGPFELDDLMITVAVVIVAALLYRPLRPRLGARARAATLLVATLAGLTLLAMRRNEHRPEALRKSFFIHSLHRTWVDPALTLDDGPPHRIAVTHGITDFVDTGMFYFLMGSRLQNRLLSISPMVDGTHPFDVWGRQDDASYERWVERLEAEQVDHVMSMFPYTLECSWMEQHPERFRSVHSGSGSWGLYQLLPRPR